MSQDRIFRGLQQRLYLIDVNKIEDNHWLFDVEGSTGNIYEVNISNNITCECIDFHKRHKICKHIYFIIGKVLDKKIWLNSLIKEDPDINLFNTITEINLNEYIHNKIYEKTNKKELKEKELKENENEKDLSYLCDEVCGICYDNFQKEDLVDKIENCLLCKNYLHKSCLKVWLPRSCTCPYCRTKWHELYINKEEHNGLEKFKKKSD